MATNRRKRLQPRRGEVEELDACLRWDLETGQGFFPRDTNTLRRAWEVHRQTLLAERAQSRPGRRPFAWWLFEAVPKYGERRVIADMTPADLEGWRCRGILQTADVYPPLQEPEEDYLRRHGLLTAAERRALEAAA